MKKYLSKKYIKYIGSLCAVWAALWNVFLLGVSLENSGPAADSTLLQCILGSENYAHDFFTRQFWFISVFVFYMAVYLVIFLFLQHESGKYRSMKLHRYGKKGYLNHCESKVLHGSLYAVLLVAHQRLASWQCGKQGSLVSRCTPVVNSCSESSAVIHGKA